MNLKYVVFAGLTSSKAELILEKEGLNILTPPRTTPEIVKFLQHMFYGFAMILWFGLLLSYLAYLIEYYTTDEASLNYVYIGKEKNLIPLYGI